MVALTKQSVSALEKEQPLYIFDLLKRLILTRTVIQRWMLEHQHAEILAAAIHDLVSDDLMSSSFEQRCAKGSRGPHFPCIIGYQRQYQKVRRRKPDSPIH
jgi:hypothetical protein